MHTEHKPDVVVSVIDGVSDTPDVLDFISDKPEMSSWTGPITPLYSPCFCMCWTFYSSCAVRRLDISFNLFLYVLTHTQRFRQILD